MNIWVICLFTALFAIIALATGYTLVGWMLLGLVGVSLLLAYRLVLNTFVGEVKTELDKCSWPWDPNLAGFKKFKELRDSTVVVILSVILLAGFVTTCDWIFTHLVGFLTGTRLLK